MTKDEAITALRHGEKVTHSYFMPGDYIYIGADGELYDESGICMYRANFWRLRHGEMWATGWDIYTDTPEVSVTLTSTQRQRSYEASARIAFWALVALLMLLTYICITH
jgi:hypothetical protein